MKIETILVPTDFSEDAAKALETAVDLAKHFGARVEVIHAYHVEIPVSSPMGGAYAVPEGFFESIRKYAEDQVARIVSEASGSGVDVSGQAVQSPAGSAIVEAAERLPADLIVMGTRGLTGLKHVLLGSVADRTVRMAPCPVLTVKADG